MKQKVEKAKTFVKEHKKEILIGTGLAVAGGLIFIVTKKKPKFESDLLTGIKNDLTNNLTKLDVPDSLKAKGIEEVSSHNAQKWMDIWFNQTPLSELGNVGKELCDTYNWTTDHTLSGVLDVGLQIEEITEF